MWQEVKTAIRKFEQSDIVQKVEWINNPANNQFLHYDIPITIEGTRKWFDSHKDEETRYDAVIEFNGISVGIIGLLNIDKKNAKAEYYIAMGDMKYKGRGIAKEASRLILKYGFETLGLNRIYLFTEVENVVAQGLFSRVGFIKEGIIRQDVKRQGIYRDRIIFAITRKDYENSLMGDRG